MLHAQPDKQAITQPVLHPVLQTMLKPSLQLKIGQQLTMTPQLQQAIRLLQLPVIDLQSEIQGALEENVMLESVEDSGETSATENIAEEDREREAAQANEVEVTWGDTATLPIPESSWSSSSGPRSNENRGPISQDFAPRAGQTLQEHLLWQLRMERFDPREYAIGRAIIDAVNDDGYLEDDLATLCELLQADIRVDEDEVEAVLLRVQQFDPAGVACRDVSECLEIQLDQLDEETGGLELARRIIREGLDDLGTQRYAALRRRFGCSDEDFEAALLLVRSLHPRPGSSVHAADSEYVIPDVFVRKIDGRWSVEINSSVVPELRVNQSYAGLVGRNSDHAVLKTQLQEARWLVRSLEIRNETVLRVAATIVERQHEFLEKGDEAMRPMILKDVAKVLDMHESTISRVTTAKYMHTPRGVFEFRHFFSSHVGGGDSGDEVSSTAIRAMIKKLISNENPKKPLSDNKLAAILAEDNINVARRTVAKYRESMSIPSSSERKRLALRH